MPLTADDHVAITQLYARQAWALDTGDVDAYVSVFTGDAVLNLAEVHQGQDKIRRFAEAFRAQDVGMPFGQHIVSQLVLEGDGARCAARAYVTRTYRLPGRVRNNVMIIWSGYYADTLVKADGKWLIQEQVGRAWEGPVIEKARQARSKAVVTA
jgi:uncharacterized protein (TIGR02246 family)